MRALLQIIFILALAVGSPALTSAETLSFEGALVHTQDVQGMSDVVFDVTSDSGVLEGATVTLTNPVTGEAFTAQTVAGKVFFSDVGPGVWTVTTDTPGISFHTVSVGLAGAGTGLAAGGIATAGVAALAIGGTTALAVGVSNAQDDDEREEIPLSPFT